MTNTMDFRIEFSDNGTLQLNGLFGWKEATCPICHQPIHWCLDMFSFTTGPHHELAHARCVWTAEAFDNQSQLAPTGTDTETRLEDLSVGYESRSHQHHSPDNRLHGCADCRREMKLNEEQG